jgi:hypothetical protein
LHELDEVIHWFLNDIPPLCISVYELFAPHDSHKIYSIIFGKFYNECILSFYHLPVFPLKILIYHTKSSDLQDSTRSNLKKTSRQLLTIFYHLKKIISTVMLIFLSFNILILKISHLPVFPLKILIYHTKSSDLQDSTRKIVRKYCDYACVQQYTRKWESLVYGCVKLQTGKDDVFTWE